MSFWDVLQTVAVAIFGILLGTWIIPGYTRILAKSWTIGANEGLQEIEKRKAVYK